MDEESLKNLSERRNIEAAVLQILKASDLETTTEFSVRSAAAERLGFELSGLAHRRLVRQLIDSFLLSNADSILGTARGPENNDGGDKNEARGERCERQQQRLREGGVGLQGNCTGKVICKLSEKRWVTIHDPYGITVLSIRDFFAKDGSMLPSKGVNSGINLTIAQWFALRKSFSSIEEAISKLELQLRGKCPANALDNQSHRFEAVANQKEADMTNPVADFSAENNQTGMGVSDIVDTASSPSKRKQAEHKAEITNAVAESAAGNTRRMANISNLTSIATPPIKRKLTETNTSWSVNTSNCQVHIHTGRKQETVVASGSIATSGSQENVPDPDEIKQLEADTSSMLPTFPNQGRVQATVNEVPFEESEQLTPSEIKQTQSDISSTMPEFPAKENLHSARMFPTQPARFDGRNYHCWRHHIEFFLNQLNIAYVLTEPYPSIPMNQEASSDEKVKIRVAAQRWINDDYLCHHHMLNSLCDSLFQLYSQKAHSARELWEELNSVYNEDFGTRISQINQYIHFQIFDGASVLEQVEKLNKIANSIMASGAWVDENFHASVIISKLPPSWKDFRVRLMHEEFVAFNMLMHRLRVEEESRNGYSKENSYWNGHTVEPKLDCRSGMRIKENKRLCYSCGKEGHIIRNCPDRKFDTCEKSEEQNGVLSPRTSNKIIEAAASTG